MFVSEAGARPSSPEARGLFTSWSRRVRKYNLGPEAVSEMGSETAYPSNCFSSSTSSHTIRTTMKRNKTRGRGRQCQPGVFSQRCGHPAVASRSVTPAGDCVSASCRRGRQWGSSGSRWQRKKCDAGVSAGGPGAAAGARGAGRCARGRVAGSSGHARAFLRGDQGRLGGGRGWG